MSIILASIESWLVGFSNIVPVWIFIAVGGFIEEVIAPIPSPLIMLSAGSIAASRGWHWALLPLLGLVGSFGKTAGAYVLYVLVDKGEDVILRRKKLFGLTHEEIEGYGKRLKATPKGYMTFIALRLLPFIPTSAISVVAGLMKVDKGVFLIGGFIGTFVREMFYLIIGFAGISAANSLIQNFEGLESFLQVVLLVLFVGLLGYVGYKKRRYMGFNDSETTSE